MKDISGKRYGKLTVVGQSGKGNSGRIRWLLVCDCGKKRESYKNQLDAGLVKCKCEIKPKIKHGMRSHPLYATWKSMISRCSNPKDKEYKNYGARGIYVSKEWQESIEKFISDMGNKPEGHSLDRIDNGKGYFRENCRWAKQSEQHENRRITARLKNGKSVNQVAKEIGESDRTIYMRLYRGWTDEEILSGRRKKTR